MLAANAHPVRLAFMRPQAREIYCRDAENFLRPATALSAGLDLRACLDEPEAVIPPGERLCVPSGLAVQPVEPDIFGLVFSRSGLGAREGLCVAQGVGVIDPDYTGEILVYLLNTAGAARKLARGERMAQLIFMPLCRPLWQETARLESTGRGSGGFGHSGR